MVEYSIPRAGNYDTEVVSEEGRGWHYQISKSFPSKAGYDRLEPLPRERTPRDKSPCIGASGGSPVQLQQPRGSSYTLSIME